MRHILIIGLLFLFGTAGAQTLETIVPERVTVGRAFNVEYRIALGGGRIERPDFDGFLVVGNGMATSNNSSSYTFSLVARRTGRLPIPGARMTVEGRVFTSQPKEVEVVEGEVEKPVAQQPNMGEELFLRAIPDRTTIWRGEAVRVIYKLYSRNPNLRSEGVKMPSLNGFWSERMDIDRYRPQTENYNSATYYTFVVGEFLLFPLQSGTLKLDALQMNLVVQQVVESGGGRSLEEMLFGAPDVVETRRTVSSPVVDIRVKELPAGAPVGFTGAVGSFTMTTSPPETALSANGGATYGITISGTGNFPQIAAPELVLPDSFEALTPKTIDETRPAARGMTGRKQFEYPMIARGEGSYLIAPVKFSFFDAQRGEYQTLTTPEVRLEVAMDSLVAGSTGANVISAQRDLEVLNRDIRFIARGAAGLRPMKRNFAFSWVWFGIAGLLAGLFVGAYFYIERLLEQRRDKVFMRGRRANKVVHARLRAASEYLKAGRDRRFYDEVLRALWGYMGDKLNIPAANLTKENIREELLRKGVPTDIIVGYTGLITECESAQYSPTESAPAAEIYRKTADAIAKIEGCFR